MSRKPLNDPAELPAELRGWNWGAFLLNWIWGLGNRTPIALLCLIPVVNLVMMVVLGVKGNAWAWRNDRWKSPEDFRRTQRGWAIAGVIVWAALITIVGGATWGLHALMTGNGAYALTMERLRADERVIAAFGEPLEDGWFPSGSVSIENASGEADLAISLSGPKAEGTAYTEAVLDAGRWRLTSLRVRVGNADELIVVVPRE